DTTLRLGARVTVGFSIVMTKLLLLFMTGYRSSLESGKPIGEALRHFSADSGWLLLASLTFFVLMTIKARGGGAMPYTTRW
ncbi:hypothetical protein, partial [Klebsiella aerogenes]|uniref:hypothetical protein n=1 Tax=Klebsiella aerogenes TaxID=548 RepID=UPI0013D02101